MTFITIIVFVLIFSLLVLVHECGHYFAARRAGVKIEEFGLGLPPRIWGKRRGGTIWSINLIPFGGFVRLKGEDGEHGREKDALPHKSYGQRMLVITGGVLMNFLLAYVLLMIGFWLGMAPIVADLEQFSGSEFDSRVVVLDLVKDSPAEQAGVKSGDIIVSINGKAIATSTELQTETNSSNTAKLVIDREGEEVALAVPTKLSDDRRMIGVLVDEVLSRVSYVWWQVPYVALVDLLLMFKQIVAVLVGVIVQLFTTASIQEAVTGPVGIAKITGEAVKLGWMYTLQLIIFLSVNLGVINIVPFPALDGGRLVFLILEISRGGKKISRQWENGIHSLGFLLLLAFIFAVTYRDIVHWFKAV
ncbi:MAG: M50 family metallopeptidase [Patescibacteria group bacterium]|jgi:regulator of sigma E protease